MTNAAPEALIFPDTVTHNEASGCLDLLRSGAQSWQGNDVRIDASALNKFDSSALAVLLQIKREVQSLGKNLTILGLPKQLQELANLYGIQSVLENWSRLNKATNNHQLRKWNDRWRAQIHHHDWIAMRPYCARGWWAALVCHHRFICVWWQTLDSTTSASLCHLG